MYESLSKELCERMREDKHQNPFAPYISPYACKDEDALRRVANPHDESTVWRGAYTRDTDKILHSLFYNRLTDKTQVFSFYKNDDITHRGLHVQLVSRIARTIGGALGLNQNLIEAISLGHDLGHTPFGHMGEKYLDEVLFAECGLHFSHNIQSVRVLDQILPCNLSLQTLNGFAAHNGEMELSEYRPKPFAQDAAKDFAEFDQKILTCMKDPSQNKTWVPGTLEACVMRICDIIAYLGKDRQDQQKSGRMDQVPSFDGSVIGLTNAEIINNLSINIIENSYNKPYIQMDEAHFKALSEAKAANTQYIYLQDSMQKQMNNEVRPLMEAVYAVFLKDAKEHNHRSLLYTHHIEPISQSSYRLHNGDIIPYEETDPALLAADYLSSMTDDYFLDLYNYLFPKHPHGICFHGYFD